MRTREQVVRRAGSRSLALLLSLGAACSGADEWTAPPREAVRVDMLGCWRLSGMSDEPTPSVVRLDSTAATENPPPGLRRVHRLDQQGRGVVKDGEGNAFVDHWSADAKSDSIRLSLDHQFRFYGSQWVLAYSGTQRDTLRGRSQAFTDVVRQSPYPVRAASATRIVCPDSAGSTSGR